MAEATWVAAVVVTAVVVTSAAIVAESKLDLQSIKKPRVFGASFYNQPSSTYREGVHLEAGRELQANPKNEMGPNLFSVSLTLNDEILHGLGRTDARGYVRIVIGDISAGRHPRPDGILRVLHG